VNPFASPARPAAPGQPPPMAQLAANPFAVATSTDLGFPEPRKKTPLIIGGIVLVVAAAGIAIAVGSSGSRPAPPPVPVAAPSPAAEAPTSGTHDSPAPDSAGTPSHPQDSIAGTPAPAPPGGDFASAFAAGAEKAQKGGTPGSAKAFDAEEARAAVTSKLKAVAACKEAGGPTGQSSAAVTFGSSGHVTSVTIGAPFSGTSTGTCIISALKGATTAPFSGLPGTVSQPVSLL